MVGKKISFLLIAFLAVLGLLDATYLTWEHYSGAILPCSTNWWIDCGKVTSSSYSSWGGIYVAVFGIIQYLLILFLSLKLLHRPRKWLGWWLFFQALSGFLFSIYFIGVQVFLINAICLYCVFSALVCLLVFVSCWRTITSKRELLLKILAGFYQLLKKIFFLFPAEKVHVLIVGLGEVLGLTPFIKKIFDSLFVRNYPRLLQDLAGIKILTPIGLAAGFDYEARLTQILPSLGFGFQTVGSVTRLPCDGNPEPRLARLPHSQSLLVNKGFRNPGSKAVIKKIRGLQFRNRLGISIGQTNTPTLTNRAAVIADIAETFKRFERSTTQHSYYELNISCPNLQTHVHFYQPNDLHILLTKIDALKISRPIFVKMPINETDQNFLELLKVIATHKIAGIIVGNLQKNRQDPSLDKDEVRKLGAGNFSGKPTFERSNHLIALAYHHFGRNLLIIGCGGVFSTADAIQKIELGASAIQLITGLIFKGPQLVSQINLELDQYLETHSYTHLSQIVGKKNRTYIRSLKMINKSHKIT